MASEQVTSAVPALSSSQLQAWLARLGLSGKLMAIGGLVGIIAVFLPLMSVSVQMAGGPNTFGGNGGLTAVGMKQSVMVIDSWRGVICLVGYLAALALTYVLYVRNGFGQKLLGWAGVGVGAFITLLAFWLLVSAFNGSSSVIGFGDTLRASVGFGAILNLLAAAAVTAGGFLKAREEKLI